MTVILTPWEINLYMFLWPVVIVDEKSHSNNDSNCTLFPRVWSFIHVNDFRPVPPPTNINI